MKKIIIIIVVLLFIKVNSKAQVADTAIYIKQIIDNKNNYIGKPLTVLENDLKIKIKKFNPFADITYDVSKETSTFFGFIYPLTEETESTPGLLIYWQPYLDHKNANTLFTKTNGGEWTPEVDSFYSPGIIKDISYLGQLVDNNGNLLNVNEGE